MQAYLKFIFQKVIEYRRLRLSSRNFLVIAAIVVGLLAGLAASLLKLITHHIESFLKNELDWQYKYYLYLLFPMVGILLSVAYVKKFIKKSSFETGLTPILYAIGNKSSRINLHNLYSHVITSALTVGFGGSTGLEAPVVTTGASIGSNLSRFFNLSYRETTMLLACGAAAGIAGAFGSPVAGIIFAIEVLLPEFSIPAFIPLIISAVSASIVGRLFNYQQMFVLQTKGWLIEAVIFYIVMAALIGLFSIYLTKVTYWIKGWFKKISNVYSKAVTGGLILGVLIFVFPALYGEGYVTVASLLSGDYSAVVRNSIFSEHSSSASWILGFTLLTIFGKATATIVTLSAGGNGGMFGPSLVMGGLIGFVFAFLLNQTGLVQLNVPNFVVAGMAAALSGVMHAPLTGVFLIAEITGGYVLMVPLMLVSCISYFISKANLKHSMYTKVLADKGELLSHEDKDSIVLRMMKLRYLVDTDFVKLYADEMPSERSADIIHSKRNVFPVVEENGMLAGIVYAEQLFEILLHKSSPQIKIKELMQAPPDVVYTKDTMQNVMSKLDKEDIWLLPVVSEDGTYQGFVSKTTIFNKYRALLIRQKDYLQ